MCRKILQVLFILLQVFLVSCRQEVTVELPDYENKLAVFCILKPENKPLLLLNRSKSYFEYADTSHELKYIDDALVVITDVNTSITDTLTVERNKADWVLNDVYHETLDPHYRGHKNPQIGHKYILEIWHKGKYVTAETTIPKPVDIKSATVFLRSESEFEGYYDYIFQLKYDDIPGEANAYITTYFGNGSYYDYEYKYDYNLDGKEITDYYYIPINKLDTGTIWLRVENNTIATADYVSSVYAQSETFTNMFTEPSIIKHNIKGGLGIFGATTRFHRRFPVDIK
jgi:hypothetical protein